MEKIYNYITKGTHLLDCETNFGCLSHLYIYNIYICSFISSFISSFLINEKELATLPEKKQFITSHYMLNAPSRFFSQQKCMLLPRNLRSRTAYTSTKIKITPRTFHSTK